MMLASDSQNVYYALYCIRNEPQYLHVKSF